MSAHTIRRGRWTARRCGNRGQVEGLTSASPSVVVVKASHFEHTYDFATLRALDLAGFWGVVPQGHVTAAVMIIREERLQQPHQVALAQNDDVVEQLPPQRPNQPLDVRILPGRVRG